MNEWQRRIAVLNDELKAKVEELQTLLDVLPIGVFVAQDPQCRSITGNPAGVKLLAVQDQPNLSKSGPGAGDLSFRVLKNGVEVPADELPMQRAAHLGRPLPGEEVDVVRADGTVVTLYEHAAPLFDSSGKVRGCIGAFVDITPLKEAERAMRDAQERTERQRRVYEAILTNTPDLAYVFDLQHRFIYANEGLLKMWGRTWDEAIGKNCLELGYEPWHAAMHDREIEQVVATRKPIRGEVAFTGSFGRRIYDYIFVPVIGADGGVEAVAGTTRDVTERTQVEEMLRTSEQRVRLAADAAELGIWVWDVDQDAPVWENDRPYEIFGIPRSEPPLSASRFKSEFLHPDDVAAFEAVIGESLRTRSRFVYLARVRRADGQQRWVEFTGRPVPLHDDAKLRMHGTVADVTEHKLAEVQARAAAESNAKIRTMFEQGTHFAGILSLDGMVMEANRLCLDACGFVREDVIGRPFWECGWWNRSSMLMELVRAGVSQAAGGVLCRRETEYFTSDGTRRHIDLTIAPVVGDDGAVLFLSSTGTDITERVLAEANLRESEERFRTLADNMSTFAWTADEKGSVYWYNKRWHDYTGTTLEQMEGWGWTKVHHPDHVERVVRRIQHSWETGDPWEDVFPLRGRNGEYRWFLSRAVPIRDSGGRILRWLGTNTDITEQVAAERALESHKAELESRIQERTRELMTTHERLRMSERLASMGVLSAGLGHDMGNLLIPIRVRLDSLEETPLSDEAREDVRAIRKAAEYLQRLTNGLRLLAMDPAHSQARESTDLQSWWADAQGVMRSVLPRGVELEVDLPDGECPVNMSRAALTQVVFNLIQNAGDAMMDRGTGRVRVQGSCGGGWVRLAVTDDGPGMTDEVRMRCMEPYFTTKARGISTGLGLMLVYGLVREIGGRVEVDSELGRGTTFTLHLPAAAPHKGGAASAPGRSQAAIIDVRDERLRSFIAAELVSLGFAVRHGEPESSADVCVFDDPGKLSELSADTSAVVLAMCDHRGRVNVRCLGDTPGVLAIRDAIRECAEWSRDRLERRAHDSESA